MASERTILLTQLDPPSLGEGGGGKRGKIERENKEEREKRNSRERSSHFSLDVSAIDSSNSD